MRPSDELAAYCESRSIDPARLEVLLASLGDSGLETLARRGGVRTLTIESALSRELAMRRALDGLGALGFFEGAAGLAIERHVRDAFIRGWGGVPLVIKGGICLPNVPMDEYPGVALTSFAYDTEHWPRESAHGAREVLDGCLVPAFDGSFGLIEPRDLDVRHTTEGGGAFDVKVVLGSGVREFRLGVRDEFLPSFERMLEALLSEVAPGWACFDPFRESGETTNVWTYGAYASATAIEQAFALSDPDHGDPALVFFRVDRRGSWTY